MIINIIRSKRKTVSLKITNDGNLIVRAPLKMKQSDIDKIIAEKSNWINRSIIKVNDMNKKLNSLPKFSPMEIKEMKAMAKTVIKNRADYYSKIIGVNYNNITIRCQKSRWGSCSTKGNLNFNCLLTQTPQVVLDGIVVHELCHLKHMNHSSSFYNEVYKVFPEYKECEIWLKENGPELLGRVE